jgi:hypothetical protein
LIGERCLALDRFDGGEVRYVSINFWHCSFVVKLRKGRGQKALDGDAPQVAGVAPSVP